MTLMGKVTSASISSVDVDISNRSSLNCYRVIETRDSLKIHRIDHIVCNVGNFETLIEKFWCSKECICFRCFYLYLSFFLDISEKQRTRIWAEFILPLALSLTNKNKCYKNLLSPINVNGGPISLGSYTKQKCFYLIYIYR